MAREVPAVFSVEKGGEVTESDEDTVDTSGSEVVALSVDASSVASGVVNVVRAVDEVGGADVLDDDVATEVDDVVELDGRKQLPVTLTLFKRHLSSSSFVFAENRSWILGPSGRLDIAVNVAVP